MKVFISWSGDRSLHIAKALHEWLPLVLQNVEPWMSAESIEAGERWGAAVAAQLEKSAFGIICVTPENPTAPWLMFEAGALAKSLESARVIPLLHDLDLRELKAPLSQFQGKRLDRAHMLDVVKSINAGCEHPIDLARVEKSFAAHWGEMERQVAAVPQAERPAAKKPKRSTEDVLEELVERVRSMHVMMENVKEFENIRTSVNKRRMSVVSLKRLNERQSFDLTNQIKTRYPDVEFLWYDQQKLITFPHTTRTEVLHFVEALVAGEASKNPDA